MENTRIREIAKQYIGKYEAYTYTELDDVDLYEFRYEEDRIIWYEELADIKYLMDKEPSIEPLACFGVGSTEEGYPLLRIETWNKK